MMTPILPFYRAVVARAKHPRALRVELLHDGIAITLTTRTLTETSRRSHVITYGEITQAKSLEAVASGVLKVLERDEEEDPIALMHACPHEWIVRRMGGPPDMAESSERVRVCTHCGMEEG